MKFSIAVKYYRGLYALIQIYKRRVNHEKFYEKGCGSNDCYVSSCSSFRYKRTGTGSVQSTEEPFREGNNKNS